VVGVDSRGTQTVDGSQGEGNHCFKHCQWIFRLTWDTGNGDQSISTIA
jgi:hypothetical protein